jgi:hypothetical protein
MNPVQTLVVILAAAGLFAILFPPQGIEVAYDRQARGHKLSLSLESQWGDFEITGDFGALITDTGEIRPDLSFSVDLTPRAPSPFRLETLPQIRFSLESPEGLLVGRGQEIHVGDLVAVRDPKEYEEIKLALAQGPDPALREELERRMRAQEVRSLISGEVVYIQLTQEGDALSVVLYVQRQRTPEYTKEGG